MPRLGSRVRAPSSAHLLRERDARMVESVDTKDLKSFGHCGCAGSSPASSTVFAEVAQLVEHNLAKVRVAGSSPVFRSASEKPRYS